VGAVTVLDVTGKVTSDYTGQLKDKVVAVIGAGHKQVVLNLSGVNFIDSSGLGELVSCHTTATRAQGAIKLCALQQRAIDLLVMTKLIMVFSVYDKEAEALAAFA
jgi:anti-sigma B factor antagonist